MQIILMDGLTITNETMDNHNFVTLVIEDKNIDVSVSELYSAVGAFETLRNTADVAEMRRGCNEK